MWGAHSLEYLGHHVGMGKVRVPEVRVRAMKDYVRPTSQKGLRAFLGVAGYYRRFMPDFSRWVGPLFGALKKGSPVKIEWRESMSDAFVYLTNALSCEHTLTMPRENDQLLVQTDATKEGIGAVLSVISDNEECPVAYYSKQLSPAEKNDTVTELECLAVVRAIDYFAIHLLGRDFTLVTDHHALAALRSSGNFNGRLLRWALALQLYSFKVKFRPGKDHSNADGLSRQDWKETGSP